MREVSMEETFKDQCPVCGKVLSKAWNVVRNEFELQHSAELTKLRKYSLLRARFAQIFVGFFLTTWLLMLCFFVGPPFVSEKIGTYMDPDVFSFLYRMFLFYMETYYRMIGALVSYGFVICILVIIAQPRSSRKEKRLWNKFLAVRFSKFDKENSSLTLEVMQGKD